MSTILVVGAGFAGGVIARELADAGVKVHVIDKRSHIAGNAYDEVNQHGERIHRYGPHLLHADQHSPAIAWLSRFTPWTPYEHRVRALLPDGRTTPLPVNRTTLEDVFGVSLPTDADARAFLDSQVLDLEVKNTDDVFLANVGPTLADLLFRPYTRKMWGVPPERLEAAVGARLPVRVNRDDRYFLDTFQAMPSQGYTAMFEKILDHENIKVSLGQPYEHGMRADYEHVFTSAPKDWHYEYRLGRLPYRSILFESVERLGCQAATSINFTDTGRYTRVTQWSLIANSGMRGDGRHTLTREIPCDPERNHNECYYPVRNRESLDLYERYNELAARDAGLTFIGRTGLFVYLDMVPCVSMHLQIARRFLSAR